MNFFQNMMEKEKKRGAPDMNNTMVTAVKQKTGLFADGESMDSGNAGDQSM